jgi:hypothetical protein
MKHKQTTSMSAHYKCSIFAMDSTYVVNENVKKILLTWMKEKASSVTVV